MDNRLTAFLYKIARDYLTIGQIEEALQSVGAHTGFALSNEHLAAYCRYIAERLWPDKDEREQAELYRWLRSRCKVTMHNLSGDVSITLSIGDEPNCIPSEFDAGIHALRQREKERRTANVETRLP